MGGCAYGQPMDPASRLLDTRRAAELVSVLGIVALGLALRALLGQL